MESLLAEMLESHESDDGSEDSDNIEEKKDIIRTMALIVKFLRIADHFRQCSFISKEGKFLHSDFVDF